MSRKTEGNPSSRKSSNRTNSASSFVLSPLTPEEGQNLGAGKSLYEDPSALGQPRPRRAWRGNSGSSSITTPSGGRSPLASLDVDVESLGAAPTIYGEARGLPRPSSRGAGRNSVSPAGDGRPPVPARSDGLPRLNASEITAAPPLAGQGNTGASRGRASSMSMRIGGLQAASSSTDPVSKGEVDLYNNIKDYIKRQAALEEKQGKYDKTSRIRFRRKARLKQEIDTETTSSQEVFDEIQESFTNLSGKELIGALTQYLDEAHQNAVLKEFATVGEGDRARNRLPASEAVTLYYNAKSNILKGLLEKLTEGVSSESHIHQSVSEAVTNSDNQFIRDKLPKFVNRYAAPQDAVRSGEVPKPRVVTRGADNYDLPNQVQGSGEVVYERSLGAMVVREEVEEDGVMPMYATALGTKARERAAAAKLSSGPDSRGVTFQASPPALPLRAMGGLIQSSKDIAKMLEDAIVSDPVRLYTKCKKGAPEDIANGSESFRRTNYAFGNKVFIIDSNAQGPFRVYQYNPVTQENKQLLTAEEMSGVTEYIGDKLGELESLTESHAKAISKFSRGAVSSFSGFKTSTSQFYLINIQADQLAAMGNLLNGAIDGTNGSKIALLKVKEGNVYLLSNANNIHFQDSRLAFSGAKQELLSDAACAEFQKIKSTGLANMQERAARFIAERGKVASRQDAAASSASVSVVPPIVPRRQTRVEAPFLAAAAASASSNDAPPVPAKGVRPTFTRRETHPKVQGQESTRPATKERTLGFAARGGEESPPLPQRKPEFPAAQAPAAQDPVVPAKSRALNVLLDRSSSASSGVEGGGRY